MDRKPSKRPVRMILSEFLGRPVTDKEHRFQPSKIRIAIYFVNGCYWSIPPASENPPQGDWQWVHLIDFADRRVYRSMTAPQHLLGEPR